MAIPTQAQPRTAAPARRVLGTFENYADAERVVDYLADRRFPVERLTIVGRDLELVEQPTGRYLWYDAATRGSIIGGILGAAIGWIFGAFNWVDPVSSGLALAFYGLVIGSIWGAISGALMHWLTGGRRDFSSIRGMRASRYEVLVDDEVAERAIRLLAEPTS
jgi:hypothetical protein